MIRVERAASGLFGEVLQNFIAVGEVIFASAGGAAIFFGGGGDPLDAGADRVDDDAGALRHFDGFPASVIGKIVFAIAD